MSLKVKILFKLVISKFKSTIVNLKVKISKNLKVQSGDKKKFASRALNILSQRTKLFAGQENQSRNRIVQIKAFFCFKKKMLKRTQFSKTTNFLKQQSILWRN